MHERQEIMPKNLRHMPPRPKGPKTLANRLARVVTPGGGQTIPAVPKPPAARTPAPNLNVRPAKG